MRRPDEPDLPREPAIVTALKDPSWVEAAVLEGAKLDGAQLEGLKGCGHIVMMDCPDDFNAKAIAFLGTLPARP